MANETSTECAAILRNPALMRQWMAKIGIDIDTITGTLPNGTVDGQLLIWDNGLVVYVPKSVSGDATLAKTERSHSRTPRSRPRPTRTRT